MLASTQFNPTLYHRFGRSCALRPTYKARGPLPPKSPDWWERDALPYKVVMAPSPRQGGTKLEWPTPHKVGALTERRKRSTLTSEVFIKDKYLI
jgi:hypothetical protein